MAVGRLLVALTVKLRQVDAGPEPLLKAVHLFPGIAKVDVALHDHVPGQHRREYQQGHDRLHGKAGIEHQVDEA